VTISPPRDDQGRFVDYVTDEADVDLHIPHPRPIPLHTPEGMSPIQALGTLLATGAIAFGCVAIGARAFNDDAAPVDPAITLSQVHTVEQVPVSGLQAMQATPAPTTVQGYRDMFDQVPVAEWGGADVSISVKMPDGRIVWLYGDTLSGNNGFVHSTAIVQDGGNLYVSHGGEQLLPDDEPHEGRERIYWIETAEVIGHDTILIKAQRTSIGTESVWDFHRDGEKSRAAIVKVEPNGDVTFDRWIGWTKAPDLPKDFVILGPNHFKYQPVVHEHIPLAGGGHLKTWSQNWDDSFADHVEPDGSLSFKDWRPIYTSTRADGPDGL
jgi:hypothetical protein